jgi:ligand-binding sensor domain-containing protein
MRVRLGRLRIVPLISMRRARPAEVSCVARSALKPAQHTLIPVLISLLGCCAAEQPRLLPFNYAEGAKGMYNGGVRAILQDRSGAYWFGSHFEGVCRVDGERMQLFTEADGLSNNQVRSIQEDAGGTIWLDAGVGISSIVGGRVSTPVARRFNATDAWRLAPDDLWFKGNESMGYSELELEAGVYRYDGSAFTYLTFPLGRVSGTDHGYSVTGICRGKGGRVWIATYAAVFGWDGTELTMIDGTRMGLGGDDGLAHVRCVFEDSKGRLWIGNNGVGVIVIDGTRTAKLSELRGVDADGRETEAPAIVASNPDANAARSLLRVFAIGEDREGCIWIGTIGGGAWRYDGRTLRQFAVNEGLTIKDVMSIYKDRAGDLWVGGKGVFRLNGDRFVRVH